MSLHDGASRALAFYKADFVWRIRKSVEDDYGRPEGMLSRVTVATAMYRTNER